MASNYHNQLQAANAKNQGLFGLAGAGLGAVGQAGAWAPSSPIGG